MNRTAEYFNFLRKNGVEIQDTTQQDEKEEMFYDDILTKIESLNIDVTSYIDILKKEQEFNNLSTEIIRIFDMIDLEVNNDVKSHFEGIKNIILMKLNEKCSSIQNKKRRFINKNIHLEPEKPFVYLKAHENKKLEKENQMILKEKQSLDLSMERAQKSLQEIKQIQNQINVHLNVQNESIKQICRRSKSTCENMKGANKFIRKGKEKKRLMRRALFLWLLCVSFLVLFLNYHY